MSLNRTVSYTNINQNSFVTNDLLLKPELVSALSSGGFVREASVGAEEREKGGKKPRRTEEEPNREKD